jgi:hypothetical protein
MRTIVITIIAVALLFAASIGGVWYSLHLQKPEVILEQLRRGKGDRQEQLMKLQLARGEVVGVLIKAQADTTQDRQFRVDLLELLFRRYQREPERELKPALEAALHDPDAEIRKKAAYGFSAFGDDQLKLALLDSVIDESPEVRWQAYGAFLGDSRVALNWFWGTIMSDEQREKLVERCRDQMSKETDPELQYLARSVVGRQVEIYLDQSREALTSGDLVRAESLLQKAIELDPSNQQGNIRYARYFLTTGEKAKALDLAEKCGALFHIPKLARAPSIDGDPNDPAWSGALKVPIRFQSTSRFAPRLCEGKSDAYLGHHEGRVYIAVLAYEDNLDKLVVKHTTRDSNTWEDDSTEIFFDPELREKSGYQFVINPAGALWDEYDGSIKNSFPADVAAKVWKDRGYWSAEFSISVSDLNGQKITRDSLWGFNVGRPRIGNAAEYCNLWPTFGGSQKYHAMPLAVFDGL